MFKWLRFFLFIIVQTTRQAINSNLSDIISKSVSFWPFLLVVANLLISWLYWVCFLWNFFYIYSFASLAHFTPVLELIAYEATESLLSYSCCALALRSTRLVVQIIVGNPHTKPARLSITMKYLIPLSTYCMRTFTFTIHPNCAEWKRSCYEVIAWIRDDADTWLSFKSQIKKSETYCMSSEHNTHGLHYHYYYSKPRQWRRFTSLSKKEKTPKRLNYFLLPTCRKNSKLVEVSLLNRNRDHFRGKNIKFMLNWQLLSCLLILDFGGLPEDH